MARKCPFLPYLKLCPSFPDGHTHSLLYLYTALSEPIGDLPQFTALGYEDGFLAGSYNSITERAMSRASWMKKIEEEDPNFWDWMTRRASHSGQRFRKDLENILQQNNQSRGKARRSHILGAGLIYTRGKTCSHPSYGGCFLVLLCIFRLVDSKTPES